jgi:ribonuclease HII
MTDEVFQVAPAKPALIRPALFSLLSRPGLQLFVLMIQRTPSIDEAGRGPLAGPVVAAAVVAPLDVTGVVDSKKINQEEHRELVYERLVTMEGVRWAVCVVDAARIDDINILQATLEGMRSAALAVVGGMPITTTGEMRIAPRASVDEHGCYVVCSVEATPPPDADGHGVAKKDVFDDDRGPVGGEEYYALVDGNRLPTAMPCGSEAVVKGDSKEFCIAAASILAKVTRDRLMRGYDRLYPQYNLKQHKGYPTQAHVKAVQEYGASPIHRRTFRGVRKDSDKRAPK